MVTVPSQTKLVPTRFQKFEGAIKSKSQEEVHLFGRLSSIIPDGRRARAVWARAIGEAAGQPALALAKAQACGNWGVNLQNLQFQ